MIDYNVFNDGRLIGCMYSEAGEWLFDDGNSTEVCGSVREYTADLERCGYTVEATSMVGLTQQRW